MKKLLISFVLAVAIGCASTPVKQVAVGVVQTGEQALATAHTSERKLCFTNPSVEFGLVCSNPLAAKVGLTNDAHHKFTQAVSDAFGDIQKSTIVLKAWRSGDPVPTTVTDALKDLNDALNVAQGLAPTNIVNEVQKAINDFVAFITKLGVK